MSSPNQSSLVLVDHYIHPATTICDNHQPTTMELQGTLATDLKQSTDGKRTLADGNPTKVRRHAAKKQKIQHQPAPLAPRLIAPLQGRPLFAPSSFVPAEATPTTTLVLKSSSTSTMLPPMPTSPHEIAREAMRITQEAMKKQKLQDLLQLQKQQRHTTSGSSSTALLLLPPPPPLLLQHQQLQDTIPSACNTTTQTRANFNTPPSNISNTLLPTNTSMTTTTGHVRLNKFVRRLHDMLRAEKNGGIVEWRRRGLLVLHNTHLFAKTILPRFFNTRNFKTFRRQLNYYGFVHVRSFANTTQPSTTTALWVHQELAAQQQQQQQQQASSSSSSSSSLGSTTENQAHHNALNISNNDNNNNNNDDVDDDIAAVLQLRRVEACDAAIPKTAEGRRHRKEQAIHTVEEDLGVNAKTLQMEHIQSLLAVPRLGGSSCTISAAAKTAMMSDGMDDTQAHSSTLMSAIVLPKAADTTAFTNKALDESTPRGSNKNNATMGAATNLQQVKHLLPAVPLEISVPRNGCSTAALAAYSDQETTQGAATLLLMLSKAV